MGTPTNTIYVFPRIVTNGKYYRIETKPGKYDQQHGYYFGSWDWQTKWYWRAVRRLKRIAYWQNYAESIKPDRWKPVLWRWQEPRK